MLSIHMNISVYMKNITRLLQYTVCVISHCIYNFISVCNRYSKSKNGCGNNKHKG